MSFQVMWYRHTNDETLNNGDKPSKPKTIVVSSTIHVQVDRITSISSRRIIPRCSHQRCVVCRYDCRKGRIIFHGRVRDINIERRNCSDQEIEDLHQNNTLWAYQSCNEQNLFKYVNTSLSHGDVV